MIKFFNEWLRHRSFILFLLVLLIFIAFYKYTNRTIMSVIVKFADPNPIPEKMKVYYRGYKIGNVSKIRISDDLKYTLVYVDIKRKNLKFPKNTTANLKSLQDKNTAYIEFSYPQKPSEELLANKDYIIGKRIANLDSFFESNIENGIFDNIVVGFNSTISNSNLATAKINDAAIIFSKILEENKPEIKKMITNTAETTENLNRISKNLSDILDEPRTKSDLRQFIYSTTDSSKNIAATTNNIKRLSADKRIVETIKNINAATDNMNQASVKVINIAEQINQSSENINQATKSVKKSAEELGKTIQKTNCALDETTKTIKNTNAIGTSVGELINKRFLFIRLMFGKPGNYKNPHQEEICK